MSEYLVESEVAGTVWKVEAEVGASVAEGDTLIILESMKMEIPVEAPEAGKVVEIRVQTEQPVEEGDVVAVLDVG
ncbi:MAG: biotin/lipoyl-binding carrier protein [Gammaproteobacteria bacterium]|jgi:acetyl-CoA carboxylase biotin carboxyl carrier protein